MNAAAVLAICSGLIAFAIGVAFAGFWRTPGWKRTRVYAVIAFSAAWYAANNVFFSAPGASDEQLLLADSTNYLLAAVHVSAWLLYAFADLSVPWRSASTRVRVAIFLTLALGALTFVRPLHFTGNWAVTELHSLAVVYRAPEVTLYGQLVGFWDLLVVGAVFVHYWRALRRAQAGAGLHFAGFAFFYLCCTAEVLVSNGMVDFLSLGMVGFCSNAVVVLVQMLRGVIDDARSLERLAAQVGHEIANPLTYVQANLDMLREFLDEAHAPEDVMLAHADAVVGAERIAQAVKNLRARVRPKKRTLEAPSRMLSAPRILAIDDDAALLRSVSRLLSPHRVLTCSSGQAALELLANDRDFTLILCDIMMPEISGPEMYRRLGALHPGLLSRFLFMTGGAVDDAAREFLQREGVPWVPKPLDKASLQALVRSKEREVS